MAQIIDGRALSKQILSELTNQVNSLQSQGSPIPGLVTILVGEHPASKSYVTLKSRIAQKIGYFQIQKNLPITVTEKQLISEIIRYNQDDRIHGILVQLPLPSHINTHKISTMITPQKDVDCFHPHNQGEFFSQYQDNQLVACTPAGIMEILKRSQIPTSGKHVVILGRSNLVGKPMLIMMLEKHFGGNAAVTAIHSEVKDLSYFTQQAEILIVAVGRPKLITAKMVKKGVTVIDVGVNRIGEKINSQGKTTPILCGDVDFDGIKNKASFITPVPGGVGPMTIAMLMKNTWTAFNKIHKISLSN